MKFTSALLLAFFGMILVACGEEDCTPVCDGLVCGDDGCGGSCGECGAVGPCFEGQCVPCAPDCTGRACGDDGCGGSCGECQDDLVCQPTSWACGPVPVNCYPNCLPQNGCGPDGCGNLCGECLFPEVCDARTRMCEELCIPDCEDSNCGTDGCGGSCGTCAEGNCVAGKCSVGDLLPETDFAIMFNYRGRITGVNDSESELYLMTPDGKDPVYDQETPFALTDFSGQTISDCTLIMEEDEEGNPLQTAPCSCALGCVVDDKVEWIAMSIKKPNKDGFTFQIGRFNSQLEVKMVKGIVISGVTDFRFAGNYLYYSKKKECNGQACRYDIVRRQLNPVTAPETLFTFPPEDDPDWPQHSTYKGHFKASKDGSTLALLGTTIRSQRIYQWRDGELAEIDYICMTMIDGQCVGSGSEYDDQDPVGISPDGRLMVAFTIAEKELRVRLYDTVAKTMKSKGLFWVGEGYYTTNICDEIAGTPWKFRRVAGDPVFTTDNKSLLFVAFDDCNAGLSGKPETDIFMMDLASVTDQTLFEEGDFLNLTKNPKNQSAENLVIGGFALSPAGKVLVFTATPRFAKGVPMGDNEKRTKSDREVWVMGLNGAGKAQLTDDGDMLAVSVRTLAGDFLSNLGK